MVQGSGGKLDPLGHTTCEQALAMFYRAYINLTGESQATQASVENKYPNLSPWAKEGAGSHGPAGPHSGGSPGPGYGHPITRGEMCYVAMEAYLSLYPNPIFRVEESPFTDADDPVITKAYYLGLISGFPDGTFRPDIPITREQFFKITVNFLSVCGYPYEDSPQHQPRPLHRRRRAEQLRPSPAPAFWWSWGSSRVTASSCFPRAAPSASRPWLCSSGLT